MNKIIIMGRLGRTPELKQMQDGNTVCSFSIAVSEKWTDKNGEKQERTCWLNVNVWGKQAENCSKYLCKGKRALVEGKLNQRSYTSRDGQERTVHEVTANYVEFIDYDDHSRPILDDSSNVKHNTDVNDDDIPF